MLSIKILSSIILDFHKQVSCKASTMDVLRQFQNLSWCTPDWCYPSMSRETNELLLQCTQNTPSYVQDDVEDLIKRSNSFPIPFPIDTPRLKKLKETIPVEQLQKNIRSTYPLIHSRVLVLMTHFLIYKREFGTAIEKQLYKDMTIPQFIDRLLKNRAVVFMGENDTFKLLSGEEGEGGWDSIGQPNQRPPLTLSTCLSYDEMKLSAMVYVCGHTVCINNGSRDNAGQISNDAQPSARIIGLIGPRFERPLHMEYEDIIITDEQNCPSNGYGEEVTPTTCLTVLKTSYVRNNHCAKCMWRQMWSEFYQVHSYTYEELIAYVNVQQNKSEVEKYTDRYIPMKGDIFNNEVYYKRIRILAECTLLEANSIAAEEGTSAYLNVIGCGLGVWKISPHQNDVYVLTFLERIRNLLKTNMLQHVSDVNFSYIRVSDGILALFTNSSNNVKERTIFFESKKHPNGGINVNLLNREPSSRLQGEHENKLLVITYPWDSNAHPGNEFWLGSLTGSGDPAAACSTQIAELHNAHINPHVSGNNVRVAGNLGIKPLAEYSLEFMKT